MTDKPREPSKEALEIIAMFYELKDERDAALAEVERQTEALAHSLGAIGQDVSGAYDFDDLCNMLGCLVHEVEVEKVQIERDRLSAMCDKLAVALSWCVSAMQPPFEWQPFVEANEALAEYRAFKGEK